MRHTFWVFLAGGALLLAACKGEQGPAGPLLAGSMRGFVSLYDEEGGRIANSKGVTVSLEGTSRSTMTDSSGEWQIDDVMTGTYAIVYEKDGFFEERTEELQFLGGGTINVWRIGMYRFPTFEVTELTVTGSPGSDIITTDGTVSSLFPSWRPVIVLYGLTPDVSVSPGAYLFFHESFAYPGVETFRSTIYLDARQRAYFGLTSGQRLYVRAYPAGLGLLSRYDPATGTYIPSHYGSTPSPLDSVLVP
jgi:hypothetical protein